MVLTRGDPERRRRSVRLLDNLTYITSTTGSKKEGFGLCQSPLAFYIVYSIAFSRAFISLRNVSVSTARLFSSFEISDRFLSIMPSSIV